MKIPNWVPQVRLPWNPAYRETWEAMTPDDRRWSFLFDVGVVAFLCLFLSAGLLLSGCQVRDDATATATPATPHSRDASEKPLGTVGVLTLAGSLPVIADAETGCQYIGYTGHGVTPRMGRYVDGVQHQLGCFETIHVKMSDPLKGLDH